MQGTSGSPDVLKDIPSSTWQQLSGKRIYFGHQSVGFDIVDGLQTVLKEHHEIPLKIEEVADPSRTRGSVFVHFRNGKNHDLHSKIKAFTGVLERAGGWPPDIAFFKFCFVDVTANTDVPDAFAVYKSAMESLRRRHPGTAFIHVTVPLTTVQSGIKARVKKIIGRPVEGYEDNARRNEFNDLLRKEYGGTSPLYDLAGIESGLPGGTPCSFTHRGMTGQALCPEYTTDGGHLNERGKKAAAEQLLLLLAGMIAKDTQ
jgi:hypothetical protein